MKELSVDIVDNRRDLPLCREAVENLAAEAGFVGNDLGDIVCAVFEGCVNAATHGRMGRCGPVTLTLRVHADRFEAVVKDSGNGTCHTDSPMPPPASYRGRGVPLMKALMDEVRLENDNGCRLTLVKYAR